MSNSTPTIIPWELDESGAPIVGLYRPNPHEDRWDQITIAEFTFPPLGYGVAVVKVTSGQKLDEKAGAGTDKASTSQTGVQLTKAEVEVTVLRPGWVNYLRKALREIDPNNADRLGGPFEVKHPDLNQRNCTSMLVEKIGPVEWPGAGFCKFSISLTEWIEPAPTDDATTTPEESDKSTDTNSTENSSNSSEADKTTDPDASTSTSATTTPATTPTTPTTPDDDD